MNVFVVIRLPKDGETLPMIRGVFFLESKAEDACSGPYVYLIVPVEADMIQTANLDARFVKKLTASQVGG